jgi:hypothetical protein
MVASFGVFAMSGEHQWLGAAGPEIREQTNGDIEKTWLHC